MNEYPTGSKARGTGLKIALVGGGLAAGVIVATALGANAATTSGSGSSATTTQPSATQPPGPPGNRGAFDHGGSAPVRGDEQSLGSAALTAKLKAAALKAVPGGTVYRVETDAGDGTYEAHMTKADGSLVTVKFDKFGTVTGVEQGMGKGDPHP